MSKHPANTDDVPLKHYMKKARKAFVYAALFSLCINILMLVIPLYSLQVLDRVLSSRSVETLVMLTIIMVIVLLFYGAFYAVRNVVLTSISEWLDKEISPILLTDSVVKASLGFSVNASQSQRDLNVIRNFITTAAPTLLDAPWSLIFLLVIYMINPVLGFISVIGIIILIGFGILNEYSTRGEFDSASKAQLNSHYMADTAGRNAEAIEAMGMMGNVLNVWNEHQYAAAEHMASGNSRANVVQSLSRVLRLVIQIAITGVGGYLALHNELSVGGMIASSILVGRALAPFENAITLWKSWISTRESYGRVNNALSMGKTVARGTLELPRPDGRISVENIIYTPPKSAPIIKGVTFKLEPGQSLGIIGPSAAGKSTLAKLLIGLLPPTHGAARLDGAETFKWNRANFGKYAGYMPQAVDLFTGTVKDNIARMDKTASMESVVAAAQMAECHEMILRLPNGYETVVNPQMNSLSPGQRQRIGLARAVYGNPRFVVLDEPNSNLDGEGERALLVALQRMKQAGITFVVVAHRPSIVANVDLLLVLKAGVIEKFGSTADVIHQYKRGNDAPEPMTEKVDSHDE
jgi:PrtD family type I secretion system ABC transporter